MALIGILLTIGKEVGLAFAGDFLADKLKTAIESRLPARNHDLENATAEAFKRAAKSMAEPHTSNSGSWSRLHDDPNDFLLDNTGEIARPLVDALIAGDPEKLQEYFASRLDTIPDTIRSGMLDGSFTARILFEFAEVLKEDKYKRAYNAFMREMLRKINSQGDENHALLEQILVRLDSNPPDPSTAFHQLSQSLLDELKQIGTKVDVIDSKIDQLLAVAGQLLPAPTLAPAPNQPESAKRLTELAFGYFESQNYEASIPLYKEALEITERALGPDHADTGASLNNLADAHFRRGLNWPFENNLRLAEEQFGIAQPLYERAISIRERAFGPDSVEVAVSACSLASMLQLLLSISHKPGKPNSGDTRYAIATQNYARALSIFERIWGPEDDQTTICVEGLASIYELKNNFHAALPLRSRALATFEKKDERATKILPLWGSKVSYALANLARVYEKMGDYQKALPFLQRRLILDEERYGAENEAIEGALHHIAFIHSFHLNQHAEALPYLERLLAISEKNRGSDHSETLKAKLTVDICRLKAENPPTLWGKIVKGVKLLDLEGQAGPTKLS